MAPRERKECRRRVDESGSGGDMGQDKETSFELAAGIIVGALLLCLPLGLTLAIYYNEPAWLWLSFMSLVIFMAG